MRNGNYSPYTNGHTPTTNNGHGTFNSSGLSESLGDISLVHSPPVTPEVKNSQLHPKTLVERARMNVGWLDSSLSIMEQGKIELWIRKKIVRTIFEQFSNNF